MRRSSLAFLALLAPLHLVLPESALAEPHAPDPEEISGAIEASNRFALELFQVVSDDSGNLLFSPLGISNILGVVYAGARGGTRDEMARTFHLPDDQEETYAYDVYSKLLCRIQDRARRNDCRLLLRCRLWGTPECLFLDGYLARIQERHGTAFSLLDPADDPHAAAAASSGRTAQDAGEPYPDLFSEQPEGTRLALTGAVALSGSWAFPFDAGETRRAPFYALEQVSPWETRERSVFVPMMRRTGSFGYARRGNVQVLEIPFREPTLSLIVLLPDRTEDLFRLQEEIGSLPIDRWWNDLESTQMRIALPRFRLTGEPDLERALRRMGVCSAFYENTADFSGMAAGERLCLGRLRHLCSLTLEEGDGAGADETAAARLLRFGENPDGPPEMRVDRPFLLLVRDNASGGILVLGRVMNPAI
ncbi:MAG: hypothetical protein JW958_11725 [Candidatus Eisenbacteria bacterium]|nr:hypothetical protein [Candidatus Eisenbacteria bacterium]